MAKPDGRYSLVEIDPETRSDAAVVRSFKSNGTGIQIGSGFAVAVVTAFLTWYATHASGPVPNCATKDSVDTLDRKVDQLSTSFSALTEKVITDSERAHNDLVDLKLKVIEQGSKQK